VTRRLALSVGEPAGIGPDLAVLAAQRARPEELVAYADPALLEARAERLGLRFRAREVWVVGDTPDDIRCGRASGLRTLAVATGRHGREELAGHDADRVLADLADTEGVLEEILS